MSYQEKQPEIVLLLKKPEKLLLAFGRDMQGQKQSTDFAAQKTNADKKQEKPQEQALLLLQMQLQHPMLNLQPY